ncbi:MAG: hypothetical protein KJ714_10410 [Euryarchaeota archaeon]|nr:hypothetical protein [Euryarchaeota archaeon]
MMHKCNICGKEMKEVSDINLRLTAEGAKDAKTGWQPVQNEFFRQD